MNSFEAQAIPVPSTVRRPLPSPRLAAAAFLLAAAIAVVLAWGEGWAVHPGLAAGVPTFRYVNSGWIAPLDAREAGAFSEELRAFVILSQEELDAFEDGYVGKVTRGNATALGRIDFDRGVLLGAYYIWRPVQGDPLAVAGVRPKGSRTYLAPCAGRSLGSGRRPAQGQQDPCGLGTLLRSPRARVPIYVRADGHGNCGPFPVP